MLPTETFPFKIFPASTPAPAHKRNQYGFTVSSLIFIETVCLFYDSMVPCAI